MAISLNNLSVKYGDNIVLDRLNLTIENNKITCILGASGIGKTTILGCLAGTVSFSGTIENLTLPVSYIFQNDRLIPNISVGKNLELVLRKIEKDKVKRKETVKNILKTVELENSCNSFPTELSGGMANRVAMARGFIYPSRLLLMDETFKGLDPALKARLINAFLKLYTENPKTVVFVTHSIDEALLLADNVIVLKNHPAQIAFQASINIEQQYRSLTDNALDDIRRELLSNLLSDK